MQQQKIQVPLAQLVIDENPRKRFDPVAMAGFVESVRAQGILQPLLVRPIGEDRYKVIAGGRRYRAATTVGLTAVPVYVLDLNDEQAAQAALAENVDREPMTPVEEAEQAAKILGQCAGDRAEAARRMGWKSDVLDKRLALMNCSDKVREALTGDKILLGHAELLASLAKEVQDIVLGRILAAPARPTIQQLKSQIEQTAQSLDAAIFDKSECAKCQYNSAQQQALFGEAISGSNCTSGTCYKAKTTEALNQKAESLKDEYPVIKIVQPGENFIVLALKAEGPHGVGEEQALACRGCANFGAAISAIPDSIGKVYRHQCFDPSCNASKVAARMAAEKEATKEAAATKETTKATGKATVKKSDGSAGKAEPKKEKKAAPTVKISQRVKDYRVKVWRKAYQVESQATPERNITLLLVLAMTHNLGKVSDNLLRKAFGALTKQDVPTLDIAAIGNMVSSADVAIRDRMVTGIAASVSQDIEEHTLTKLLEFLDVDLRSHWKLNAEFLDLLTKSEMSDVAEKIGLREAMGDKFSKAMTGKKDEIIKALLAVEGFDYSKTLPMQMDYRK